MVRRWGWRSSSPTTCSTPIRTPARTAPPSFVRLLGVDETRRRARALLDEALAALAALPAPTALSALARFTVERDH